MLLLRRRLLCTQHSVHSFPPQAVSGHVDAAFAQHPDYQIARDNEHVFFIDNEQLAAANLAAKPGGGTP